MSKRSTASTAKPTRGVAWQPNVPRRYVVLRAFVEKDRQGLVPESHELIRVLADFFGDDRASAHARRVQPGAWNSDVPWRAIDYGASLRLPASTFGDPGKWAEITDHASQDLSWLDVHRGGGSSRHLLWKLDRDHHEQSQSFTLMLPLWYFDETDGEALDRIIETFFRVHGSHIPRYGDMELWAAHEMTWAPFHHPDAMQRWACERVLLLSLQSLTVATGGVRPVLFLPTGIAARLGSPTALRQRLYDILLRRYGDWYKAKPDAEAESRRAVKELPDGLLLTLFEWPRLLEWTTSKCRDLSTAFGPLGGPMQEMLLPWILDELLKAGLMFPQGSMVEMIFAERARVAEMVRKERESAQPAIVAEDLPDISLEDNRKYLDAHPPRCILGPNRREEPPLKELGTAHHTTFRLLPRSLGDAVPVYGRKAGDGLTSPIVVGAIQPDRASLVFDLRVHGWDGEFRDPPLPKVPPLGRLRQLACDKCHGRSFHAWAVLEDTEVDELEEKDLPRRQDLFCWFWLVTKCVACGKCETVADVECA